MPGILKQNSGEGERGVESETEIKVEQGTVEEKEGVEVTNGAMKPPVDRGREREGSYVSCSSPDAGKQPPQ